MADFTTPIGRLVYGNPATAYPVKDDKTGQPKLDAAGQPITATSFGVAIPKQGEQHWNQTQWGAVLWNAGNEGWGQMCQRPDFAWKVTDGDSQVPNKRGNVPCHKEGYAGHWVINFSTRISVKLFDYIHSQGAEIMQEGVIKTGHYIQVFGNAEANNKNNPNVQSPGIYVNPVYVAHSAYGPEIVSISGPDVSEVGFGGGQLPPGASTTPVGGNFNPAGQQPQQQPAQGGYQQQPQQQPAQGGYQQQPQGNAAPGAHPGHAAQSAPPTGTAQGASSAVQGNGQPNYRFAQGNQ